MARSPPVLAAAFTIYMTVSSALVQYDTKPWRCLQCMAVQRAIRTSVVQHFAQREDGGQTDLSEAELRAIISGVCKSTAWAEAEYSDDVRRGCRRRVEDHLGTLMQWWGVARTKKKLLTMAHQRWLMYSVCTQPKLRACGLRELSWSDELEPSRCPLCRAVVKDVYAITRMSRHRPTDASNASFAALQHKVAAVCEELELHRVIPADQREAVLLECQILLKDFKSRFNGLLLNRTATFARNFCNQEVELCHFEISTLPYSDDGRNPFEKDEL